MSDSHSEIPKEPHEKQTLGFFCFYCEEVHPFGHGLMIKGHPTVCKSCKKALKAMIKGWKEVNGDED